MFIKDRSEGLKAMAPEVLARLASRAQAEPRGVQPTVKRPAFGPPIPSVGRPGNMRKGAAPPIVGAAPLPESASGIPATARVVRKSTVGIPAATPMVLRRTAGVISAAPPKVEEPKVEEPK